MEEIYIFIRDDDRKSFAITGPITGSFVEQSVDEWLQIDIQEKRAGRNIQILDIFKSYLEANIQKAIEDGLTEISPNILVKPPKDRSAEYQGNLPQYAENADRDRVVKILCKRRCKTTTWAELNRIYPGSEILKRAEEGEYKARCLRCGDTIQDNYNWMR